MSFFLVPEKKKRKCDFSEITAKDAGMGLLTATSLT